MAPAQALVLFARRFSQSWSRVSKIVVDPIKNTANDYIQSFQSCVEYMKNKPYRFTAICGITGASVASTMMNPDSNSYYEEVIRYSTEASQCSQLTRNEDCYIYVTNILHKYCTSSLKLVNVGILSLVYPTPTLDGCCSYSQKCTYLLPTYKESLVSVMDVGFWRQWWILPNKMVDYDIKDT